jgi:hypothetical protein
MHLTLTGREAWHDQPGDIQNPLPDQLAHDAIAFRLQRLHRVCLTHSPTAHPGQIAAVPEVPQRVGSLHQQLLQGQIPASQGQQGN